MPGAERLRDSAALTELVAKQVRGSSADDVHRAYLIILAE